MGVTYNAVAVSSAQGTNYQVTLLYGDQANNQITSDPANCIDWRIYQTNNAFNVDSNRKYIQTS
jgi:hypothetical protein